MEHSPKNPNNFNSSKSPDHKQSTSGNQYRPNNQETNRAPRETTKTLGAELVDKESSLFARKSLSDFKATRNNLQIDRATIYLTERKKDFSRKGFEARKFEEFSRDGMVNGDWLGNIPNREGQRPFQVHEIASGDEFDDVVNKVDTAVEMTFPSGKTEIIGVDVTLNNSEFTDKLFRSTSNPQKSLPYGFSSLDYPYRPHTGELLEELPLVPRYCISADLSEHDIKNREFHTGRIINRSKHQAESKAALKRMDAEMRFKVLSEIHEQNLLTLTMLPENLPAGPAAHQVAAAREKVRTVERGIWGALNIAANHCLKDKAIYDKQLNTDVATLREQIIAEQDPREKSKLQHERYKKLKQYYRRTDENYGSLITDVEDLKKLAKAGDLDQFKAPRTRNTAYTPVRNDAGRLTGLSKR